MGAFPHYIGSSWSSGPYTCWSPGSLLEYPFHQTPLSVFCELRQLRQHCSGGLLHINAARKVVAVHLMWWWQLFLRYFEFSSFSRVQGAYFNCLSIHLVCVCCVRGGTVSEEEFLLGPSFLCLPLMKLVM